MHRLSFRKPAWLMPLALLAAVTVAAVVLFGGRWAAADHPEPDLPLTADIVEALSVCPGADIPPGTEGNITTPPDRKNGGSDNDATEGTLAPLVIHANAEDDAKELTLDVSGSHLVLDGLVNSRSHLKVGGSFNQFRHGTEYGQRSDTSKDAFDLSGSNNCFSGPDPFVGSDPAGTPAQVYQNAPPAPDGFPFSGLFDTNNDGAILEHFAPGTAPAIAAAADGGKYFECRIGFSSILLPLLCDTSSAKMVGTVQGEQLPEGLYVVEGEVNLAASNLNARITIVAGQQLKVNGSFQGQGVNVFRPYTDASGAIHGQLLFASEWETTGPGGTSNTDKAEDALKIEGSLSRFEGIIVAPNGRVEIAGEQLDFRCPVMGDRVRLNGSKNYFNATGCVPQPNVQIEKTPDGEDGGDPDGQINAGDLATFRIEVTNGAGAGTATNVDIEDVLPGTGWSIIEKTKSGTPLPQNGDECLITGGNILHCDIATLAAEESVVVIVQRATTTADCEGDQGEGTIEFLDNGKDTGDPAVVEIEDSEVDNDPGHIRVFCPDVGVEKTGNGTINAGQTAQFTITITNNGPGVATNITLDPPDELPDGGLDWNIDSQGFETDGFTSGNKCSLSTADILSCTIETLSNVSTNNSYRIVLEADTDSADCGPQRNDVTITADGDINSGNNTDFAIITILCPDVTVLKTSNGTINAGETAQFTILITNNGPGVASNITLNPPDELPDGGLDWNIDSQGFETDGFTSGNKCSLSTADILSCTIETLSDVSTNNSYRIVLEADTDSADCGEKPNTVIISATGDIDLTNNESSATVTILCGALLIEKRSTKTVINGNGNPLVSTAGAVFDLDGPDASTAKDFSVTDDETAAAPDEDAAIGKVCVSGLQPGTWTVNEFSPPTGYGDATETDLEAIVVGIPNAGPKRLEEYAPFRDLDHGKRRSGDKYLSFITEMVKPLIDRDFRTLPDRAHTGMIGSSMGGRAPIPAARGSEIRWTFRAPARSAEL